MYSIHEKFIKQGFRNEAFVANEFAEYSIVKVFVFQRFTIIYISPGKQKIKNFTFVVYNNVKLNPKNHPIEDFPIVASPLKVLFWCSRLMWHTLIGVESIKETPVHFPRQHN